MLLLLAINFIASLVHFRIDLTEEKRYTLSKATKNLLRGLDDYVTVDVYLKGDLKAGIKKLAQSTNELLQDFKEYSNGNLRIRFVDPIGDYDDSTARYILESLARMGIQPMTQEAQSSSGTERSQSIVIPGAVVQYREHIYPVNLLSGVKNTDINEIYTNAEALLEYKFYYAINKLVQPKQPLLGYLTGNGEPLGYQAYSALTFLSSNYRIDSLNLAGTPAIPDRFDALVMVQPQSPFNDQE